MQRLPIDISTFARIRELNCLYVDKTEYMYKMITQGQRYFLSRPRRFGKSLLVSTLQEILMGNKHLFNDLWIGSSDYSWQEYGIINLDFSKIECHSIDTLHDALRFYLNKIANAYNIEPFNNNVDISIMLEAIVDKLFQKFKRVAILVDEYDAPILKSLHNKELAEAIQNNIQQFFTTIKSLDAQVQFVFITGVSSFAKAGLFSGINNLRIMTLDDRYATLCGYTDHEIDHYFNEHVVDWANTIGKPYEDLRQQIKTWYNGYAFGYNVPKVYNPFSVMNALDNKKFKNFWFTSGAPTFLIDVLKKEYKKFDPERLMISEDMLGIFDIGAAPVISLMFQAGYLTIVDYDTIKDIYKLDYPNDEVNKSFQKYLLEVFTHIEHSFAQDLSLQLFIALDNNRIKDVIDILKQLFAHIPYQLHIKEERYYHTVFMIICVCAGIKAQSEFSTEDGRIDLVMEFEQFLYVVEIKFNDPAKVAFKQIEERAYYQRFLSCGKQIILLALAFKKEPHNFDIEYIEKRL